MDRISRGSQFGDSDDATWLPPWLRGVPLPPRPPSRAAPPEEQAAPPDEPEEAVPDWLQGAAAAAAVDSDQFRSEESAPSSAADAAIPDWLRDLQSDIGAMEEDEPLPVDDQPDWLTSLTAAQSSDLPAEAAPSDSSQPDDAEMPDWLRATAQPEESAPAEAADSFPTEAAAADQAGDQPASRVQMPVGATDWLRSLGREDDAESAPAPAEQPEMGGPTAAPAEQAERPEGEGDTGVPDWLRDISPDEVARDSAEPEPFTPPAPAETESSDWMVAGAASAADAAHQHQEELSEEPGIPDWLRDISPDEMARDIAATEGGSPTTPPGAAESPDWFAEAAPADTPSASPAGDEPGIPDWLRDISPDEVSRDIAETGLDMPAAPPSSAESPDWLQSPEQPPGVTETGIPDWFQGEPGAPPETTAPTASGGEPEMPAWLSGATSEDPSTGAGDTTNWFDQPAASGSEPGGAPEMPAWLSGATPEDPSTGAGDTTNWFDQPAASGSEPEMPSWLSGASADESPTEAGSTPDWSPQSEVPAAPTAPEDAAIPSWLRGVDEPPPMPESDEAAPPEEGGAMADAGAMPDWLQSIDEPPSVSEADTPAPADAAAETELPDWLADNVGSTGAAASQEDLPSWLRADVSAESDAEPPRMPDVVEKEELPDWLSADAPSAPTAEALPEAEEPDWLRDAGSAAPPSAPAAPDVDVPDWLRDDAATAEPAGPADTGSAAPPSAPAAPDADVPDWLRDDAATAEPAGPADTGAEDIPAWLTGGESAPPAAGSDTTDTTDSSDLPPWMTDESNDPLADQTGGLPSWLQGADTELEEPALPPRSSAPPPPPAPSGAEPVDDALPSWLQDEGSEEDVPDWLREEPVAQAPAPAAVQPRGTADEGSSFLGGADLPEWLRPTEPEPRVSTKESQQVDWLSNLGVGEEEAEGPVVATTTSPTVLPRPTFTRSPAQMEAAALLQRLVARPFPETTLTPAPAEPARWRRVGLERVLYLLLALALLIGLFVPSVTGFLGSANPAAPAAGELSSIVAGLSEEDVVLVAYEWDAQRSSELRPLETAVTQHLIEQNVRFVVLSTDPQGTLLSFNFRDPLRAAGYNTDEQRTADLGGRDYVLMGYQPGGEFALRRLVQQNFTESFRTFSGADATRSWMVEQTQLETVADFDLILIMADQPQDVQGWIEQVHTSTPDVPMAFLLPFETAPVVQPYLRYPNVYQLVGRQGALNYAAASGGGVDDVAAIRSSGLQHFAALVFVVLIIVGGIAGLLLQPKPKLHPESEE
ncbi:MAG: hypothetical protein ACLFVO_22490 [Chloroflexaceae bacterium]